MDNPTNQFSLDISSDISKLGSNLDLPIQTPENIQVSFPELETPETTYNPFLENIPVAPSEMNPFLSEVDPSEAQYSPFMEEEPGAPSQFSPFSPEIELPESQTFISEEEEEPELDVQKYKTDDIGNTDLQVNPEDAVDVAKNVSISLEALKKDVERLSNEIRNPDPRSRPASSDKFEEKITIVPGNLIFENRKARMSNNPEWA